MASISDLDIWDRIISPSWERLKPEGARAILRLKFGKADIQRINTLSAKADEGTLTKPEKTVLEQYLRVGRIVTLMHSRARQSLQPSKNGTQARRKAS